MAHQFNVVVERDSDGFYVATVPALPGCHTQAKSMAELMDRIREAIALHLEVDCNTPPPKLEFIGVESVTVAA